MDADKGKVTLSETTSAVTISSSAPLNFNAQRVEFTGRTEKVLVIRTLTENEMKKREENKKMAEENEMKKAEKETSDIRTTAASRVEIKSQNYETIKEAVGKCMDGFSSADVRADGSRFLEFQKTVALVSK